MDKEIEEWLELNKQANKDLDKLLESGVNPLDAMIEIYRRTLERRELSDMVKNSPPNQ